jgi:hypothetical protein
MYTQFCLWSEPELSLTGPFYRYDLGKTFEIVVGKQPNQKSFTAYHDLLTQRSEFFRAARSERWSQDPKKPTTLDDVDVEIFSTYLHCVNWGAEFLDAPVQTILDENRHIYEEETIIKIAGDSSSGGDNTKGSDNDSSSDDEGSDESDSGDESTAADPDEVDHSIMQSTRPIETFLIDLYLLADKLIDPTTANLAIDKLVDFIEERETYLSARLIRFVNKTTMVRSPLRRLVRDHSTMDDVVGYSNSEYFQGSEFPAEFIKDVLLEFMAINRRNADRIVGTVYVTRELQPTDYHQVVDKTKALASEGE